MSKRVRTKTVYQMEISECGAACLGMVLEYYGGYVPLEQLREETGAGRDGCNAYDLIQCAKNHGLCGRGLRIKAAKLRDRSFPCILHWKNNHFVVCEGFKGDRVWINDPAVGRYQISSSELERSFSGVVLLFEKTDSFTPNRSSENPVTSMLCRIREEKHAFFGMLIACILLLIPGYVIPRIIQILTDRIINDKQWQFSGIILLTAVASFLFLIIIFLIKSFIQERIARKISVIRTSEFVEHILRLPITFFDQRYLGDIVGRSDINDRVNDLLTRRLMQVVLGLISSVFFCVLMIKNSLSLSLIAVAGAVIGLLFSYFYANRDRVSSERSCVRQGKLYGMMYAGFGISQTIKAAGMEDVYGGRLISLQDDLKDSGRETDGTGYAAKIIIPFVFAAAIIFYGTHHVTNGTMSIGMLLSFMIIYFLFAGAVDHITSFLHSLTSVRADIGRAEDVKRYPVAHTFLKDQKDMVPFSGKLSGDIKVCDLTFGYNKMANPVIENLSFSVSCGMTVALVGGSGSGKTTIAGLLGGLYQPWSGSICFDGTERGKIPENVIHASVAVISQDIVLFGGTIRQNLTMWNDNILEEDVVRAAKDACIHDIIVSRAGAYDTVLLENGNNFSGGERQRLEIARALALNPSILIMDEATSALDTRTEKKILDNIKRRGCTGVIVAHRLSAIRDCDLILVMDEGKIIQQGSHDELMSEDGLYRELVRNM